MSAIAGRVLIIPQGAYNASSTYHMLDAVSYNGNSYIAKKTTQGNTPTADNEFWMLLSAGSAVASINDIGDVLITSPTNGQVLKYNATTQKWENGQDTGGLLPHLIIISEDGESEVKAVKGSTEIIATRTSAGHYECDVPEFGTWTIHAVLNGDDATVNLVVDTVKIYTVDDSHFHADITVTYPSGGTCSCSKEGETTLYATGSPYTFTVHSAGIYTITVEQSGNTYTDTVEVTTTGQTVSKFVPSPADAPTGDINFWLWYGGIDNTQGDYSSLADILADTTALSALMASQNAVDYLVRNTSWATSITTNEDAMTYIGLNNYCANTLLADSTWCNAICNSTYFESVLNAKVPVMTSDTTPEGEAFGTVNAPYYPWKAFNGTNSSATDMWYAGIPSTIGYKFTNNVRVCRVDITGRNIDSAHMYSVRDFIVQGSDDGETYIDLASFTNTDNSPRSFHSYIFSNNDDYLMCRLSVSSCNKPSSGDPDTCAIGMLQFYGRKDV